MARKRKSPERFTRWDPAEYMKSEADMAAYLEACLEEAPDDAAFIAAALGDVARAYGMMKVAESSGLTREGLYRALSKDGNPNFDTVLKVMKALGLRFAAKAA
jgi:probable addiction module antidote protein